MSAAASNRTKNQAGRNLGPSKNVAALKFLQEFSTTSTQSEKNTFFASYLECISTKKQAQTKSF